MQQHYNEDKHQSQTSSNTTGTGKPQDFKSASSGLLSAARLCNILKWIFMIALYIGCFMCMATAKDSYSDTHEVANIIIPIGLTGWISNYIAVKVLRGLAVVAKASEKYLSTKN